MGRQSIENASRHDTPSLADAMLTVCLNDHRWTTIRNAADTGLAHTRRTSRRRECRTEIAPLFSALGDERRGDTGGGVVMI